VCEGGGDLVDFASFVSVFSRSDYSMSYTSLVLVLIVGRRGFSHLQQQQEELPVATASTSRNGSTVVAMSLRSEDNVDLDEEEEYQTLLDNQQLVF
jgi:hypothetical protein